MNKVILIGRLTRDPEVRYSQGGDAPLAIARFTLAVDRRFTRNSGNGNDQSADFISCVAFGKQGEFIEKYIQKGTKLVVEGRIQTGSYTGRDGQKVYTTEVIVENCEFGESKANASNGGNSGYAPQSHEPAGNIGDGFMNIPDSVDDEEMPFN